MHIKSFLSFVLVAVIFLLNMTCAAAKSKVIEVESSVPEIGLHQNVTFAQYFTWPESRLQMDIYQSRAAKAPCFSCGDEAAQIFSCLS